MSYNINREQFEQYAKNTTYSIYELTANGLVLVSTVLSKSAAIDFARNMTSMSSSVYIFKYKCIKAFNPEPPTESYTEQVHNQQNTHIRFDFETQMMDYNSDEDPDYVPGDITEEPAEEYESDEVEFVREVDLSELSQMKFYNYGKGFILLPRKNSKIFGEKYLLTGWWMPTLNGWFFKESSYNRLVERGATYVNKKFRRGMTVYTKDMKSSIKSSTIRSPSKQTTVRKSPRRSGNGALSRDASLVDFTLSTYGKGLILTCDPSTDVYGSKYLYDNNGFWNQTANGWFFKMDELTYLLQMGATNSTNHVDTSYLTNDSQFVDTITRSDVNFESYGRGWILYTNDTLTFERYGKYFQGGWYMPSKNCWFFRTAAKDEFLASLQ